MHIQPATSVAPSKWLFWRSILFAVLLGSALLAIPLLFRMPLIAGTGATFELPDLSGVLRDVALLCAVMVLLMLIARRWGRFVLIICLCLLLLLEAANAAFIWTFGHTIEFSQAGYILDKTFFWGSATKIQHPLSLLAGALLIGAVALTSRPVAQNIRLRWVAILGALSLVAIPLLSQDRDVVAWRQTGILTQNANSITRLFQPDAPTQTTAELEAAFALIDRELAADLQGDLWARRPATRPNVLLVILESVSAAYLPGVVQTQGLESRIKMPQLEEFARDGVIFSRFYSHQRQTTRGTFSLLCGQLPRFSSAKPRLEIAADAQTPLECLPRQLAAQGYHTEYFQAAPLGFSQKDQALPLLGYQHQAGAAAFAPEDIGSAWGPDDQVFFEHAVERIADLNTAPQPWFLTLLNVGTHHPFDIVPASFEGSADVKVRAFEYLDVALGTFLSRLRRDNMLENTIVIFASDESGGLEGPAGYTLKELSRNWGLLAAVAPDILEPQINDTPIAQFDLPISLLDLLGITPPPDFQGRSIFRSYATARTLYAYNNIGNFSYAIGQDEIDMCQNNGTMCRRLRMESAGLGALRAVTGINTAALTGQAQTMIRYSNHDVVLMDAPLLPDGSEIEVTPEDPYLVCCQYLDMAQDQTFSFDAELQLLSAAPSVIHVDIVSQAEGQFTTHFSQDLAFQQQDDTLSVTTTLQGQGPLEKLELRMRLVTDKETAPVRFRMVKSAIGVVQ